MLEGLHIHILGVAVIRQLRPEGYTKDRAAPSARFTSVCGMTAMAFVNKFPGIGMLHL